MNAYVAVLIAMSQVSAPPKLTLDEALGIALNNAFSIRIAQARVEKARQVEREARGVFGPKVTLQGTYSRFDGSVSGTGGGSGTAAEGPTATTSAPNDSKSASVTLTQIIDIAGVNREAARATALSRMAEEAGLGVEANSLKAAVRQAYFNVLLAQSLVTVQQELLKSSQERYDKAKIREHEGAIPRFDLLRFENEVRKAEQAVVQAQGTLITSKQALNNALSRPIETEFEPVDLERLPEIPQKPSEFVIAAIRARPEVKQSDYTIKSLGYVASAQNGSLSPQLLLQATHNRNIDPFPGQQDQGTIGSLIFSFPVFDSGITRAKVEAARQDQVQAKIGFEQLVLGIALEVRAALTQAETAEKAYTVALDSQKLAAEALRLAQIRYDEGAGILIDVTQAQAELTAAEGNVQNAKYQVLSAYADLLRAIGRDDLAIPEEKP